MNFFYEHAPAISLLFFFAFFIAAAFIAYRPSARKRWQECALIPLQDDDNDR